jgi:hypothetical protein
MSDSLSDQISGLVENIRTYITSKVDLLLLTSVEKVARLQSSFITIIILLNIAGFTLLFITIAAAVWLGEIFNNYKIGFLFMAVFYLLLGIIVLVFRKQIIDKKVIRSLIKILFPKEK